MDPTPPTTTPREMTLATIIITMHWCNAWWRPILVLRAPSQDCHRANWFFCMMAIWSVCTWLLGSHRCHRSNQVLSHACTQLRMPLVACQLGLVPEITSKILSVAGYHHFRGILGEGLIELWEQQRRRRRWKESLHAQSTSKIRKDSKFSNKPLQTLKGRRILHTIAILPIHSQSLTVDPSCHNRVHWCMVRLCISSPWRSKLASASALSLAASSSILDAAPLADATMPVASRTRPLLNNILMFICWWRANHFGRNGFHFLHGETTRGDSIGETDFGGIVPSAWYCCCFWCRS